jgi:hypothetical protein
MNSWRTEFQTLHGVCNCGKQSGNKHSSEECNDLIVRLDVTHQKADIFVMAVDKKGVTSLVEICVSEYGFYCTQS